MPLELSTRQARRLALSAQGFGKQPQSPPTLPALKRMLQRLGVLQIDSVNALVRSHYLPLFSRLGDYAPAMLDQLAWGRGRQRQLFEYWGHEASLLPLSLYPMLRWRMAHAADGRGIYRQLAQFGRERQDVIARVLAAVREQGALGAGSLSTRQERAGRWWDWSEEKHALEWLFAAGEVTVAGRRGFERLYDVPDNVLPRAILDQPQPGEAEAHQGLMLHAATALGVATERDLRDYFRLEPAQGRAALAELIADGRGIYRQLAQFGRERQDVIARVLAAVREQGALGAGSLSTREERAGPWWDWSEEKHALEWLFAAGEVTVAGRRGFERLYDVPDNVLPRAILDQPQPGEAEAHQGLMLHAATALGVATERDLRDYFRLEPAQGRAALAELIADGRLQAVQVQGWKQPAYSAGTPRIPRRIEASALLSPFDSLVWERNRTERLFDFRYRLEIYTPAHKRVYGYYVLPFLFDERIAARVDLRAERALGQLAVHAVHAEADGLGEVGYETLAAQLLRLARWLGLERVQLNCPREEGSQLRRALLSAALA